MSRALLIQMNGLGVVLCSATYSSMTDASSATLVNAPRRNRSVAMSRRNRSATALPREVSKLCCLG